MLQIARWSCVVFICKIVIYLFGLGEILIVDEDTLVNIKIYSQIVIHILNSDFISGSWNRHLSQIL